MPVAARPLVEQVTLEHGPRDLLARYFGIADAAVRERGISLRLRTDFDRLVDVNHQHRDSWPAFIPMFDPRHSNLRIDNAFWIEGVDEFDCPVVTHAGRVFDWTDTTLEAELRALRAFFHDPAPHIAGGDSIVVDAPSARLIRGRVMGGGAVWVRPDHRGKGLATLVPMISRAYALARWNIVGNWAVMEPKIRDMGLARRNRFNTEEMIRFRLKAWRDDLPMLLVWATREDTFADIATVVDRGSIDDIRHEELVARGEHS